MSTAPPVHLRTVRSFVRRGGRVTDAQARSLGELWPRYGVDYSAQPLDLDLLYGRSAPRTLEIGFGNGEHLATRAAAEPGRDFLGVEVHNSGVGQLLNAAAGSNLANLRVICHDAVEVLAAQVMPGTLDEVQILFPDPWPKKRHHKRRLIQPEFATLVASRLGAGGRLLLATDWAPYAEHMRTVLDGCATLQPLGGAAQGEPGHASRAPTRFEQRGQRLGHAVTDLAYVRRS
jgi:tRNA (guanine-N7-)-methyltransferase